MSPLRSSPDKANLQKQLADYTQYQWFALMPTWMPGILVAATRTPTPPDRVLLVIAFRIGMIVFGVTCFALMRAKIGKLKRAIAQLERAGQAQPAPPLAKP